MTINSEQMLAQARATVREVQPREALEMLDRGDIDLLLDVREAAEWGKGYIPGALLVPRGMLEFRADPASEWTNPELTARRGGRIAVYCAVGYRSVLAAATLQQMGYENVISIAGGFVEWQKSGLPVTSA